MSSRSSTRPNLSETRSSTRRALKLAVRAPSSVEILPLPRRVNFTAIMHQSAQANTLTGNASGGSYQFQAATNCGNTNMNASKHMDKHDRPYRCQHAQCAKLQGFTYSGGLLRHEREVHGKHGGPKAQLMCPYNECKRHSGKGFTRKENLNEHLRRVHDGKKPEEEPDANAAFQAGLEEAIRQTDMNQAVSGDAHETALPYPPPENQQYPAETAEMVKRRRIEDEPAVPSDNEDLRNEITRLQIESAQKDERIRQMETREAELATRLHHLEQEAGRVRQLEDMLRIHEAVRQVVPAAEEAQMQRPEGVV